MLDLCDRAIFVRRYRTESVACSIRKSLPNVGLPSLRAVDRFRGSIFRASLRHREDREPAAVGVVGPFQRGDEDVLAIRQSPAVPFAHPDSPRRRPRLRFLGHGRPRSTVVTGAGRLRRFALSVTGDRADGGGQLPSASPSDVVKIEAAAGCPRCEGQRRHRADRDRLRPRPQACPEPGCLRSGWYDQGYHRARSHPGTRRHPPSPIGEFMAAKAPSRRRVGCARGS